MTCLAVFVLLTCPGFPDAPCCVLPDGRVLLGSIGTHDTAIYDSVANSWTATGNKDDPSEEETWTLLPDETVLSVECTNIGKTEKYVAPGPLWVLTPHGPVPVDPWGPKIASEAREAFRQIIRGIKTLRDLGREVDRIQIGDAVEERAPGPPSGKRRRNPPSEKDNGKHRP